MADTITKKDKLNEVIAQHPQLREVFIRHGMPKYPGRLPSETIEFFSRMHKVDIQQLLEELNAGE